MISPVGDQSRAGVRGPIASRPPDDLRASWPQPLCAREVPGDAGRRSVHGAGRDRRRVRRLRGAHRRAGRRRERRVRGRLDARRRVRGAGGRPRGPRPGGHQPLRPHGARGLGAEQRPVPRRLRRDLRHQQPVAGGAGSGRGNPEEGPGRPFRGLGALRDRSLSLPDRHRPGRGTGPRNSRCQEQLERAGRNRRHERGPAEEPQERRCREHRVGLERRWLAGRDALALIRFALVLSPGPAVAPARSDGRSGSRRRSRSRLSPAASYDVESEGRYSRR